MSSFSSPHANQPPYPPFPPQPPYPPQPPRPGTEPGLPGIHVTPPMVYVPPTFEYRQLSRALGGDAPPMSDAELEELGRDGWELVSVLGDGRSAHFYFKREGR